MNKETQNIHPGDKAEGQVARSFWRHMPAIARVLMGLLVPGLVLSPRLSLDARNADNARELIKHQP